MGLQDVQDILEVLTQQTTSLEISRSQEDAIKQRIAGLDSKERILVERSFYKHTWNVGSASVVRILSDVDLFHIVVYLSNLKDPQEQQDILNDLFETEHRLLGDLVKGALLECPLGLKVRQLFLEAIPRLLQDLLQSPEITVPNYLLKLRIHYLDSSQMTRFLKMHLKCLLELHSCPSIREAIQSQFDWNNEELLNRNNSMQEIVTELLYNLQSDQLISSLLEDMSSPSFTHWKFGLAILSSILWAEPELRTRVKHRLAELFTEWISKRSEFSLHVMMLLGRQLAYSTGTEKADSYKTWYKYQIGDMNYKLKSKDDFQYAVKTLSSLIPLESDPDFLGVHISTPIPAPAYCKVYVTEFKQLSKIRDIQLHGESIPAEDDVIIIP